jgi:hypothetical protein
MGVSAEHVEVWAASIKDEPGGLAWVLAGLREAGADLDFIIARRAPDKPGTGVVFVAPLRGASQVAAAGDLGFDATRTLHAVRAEGENKPGIVSRLTEKLAQAGLNLRGLSAAAIADKFILYIGLDTDADAERALEILRQT